MKTLTITVTMPQVRGEAANLIMVQVETNNFEGSYNEIEAKDLSIVNVSFKNIAIRGAPQQNHTQYGYGCKPNFPG